MHIVMLQADRGVANELAEARADWQASLAEDARELKVSCLRFLLCCDTV